MTAPAYAIALISQALAVVTGLIITLVALPNRLVHATATGVILTAAAGAYCATDALIPGRPPTWVRALCIAVELAAVAAYIWHVRGAHHRARRRR